jgi:hypothetical protein
VIFLRLLPEGAKDASRGTTGAMMASDVPRKLEILGKVSSTGLRKMV